jgi:GT2 family glycosyltransferase
MLVEALRSVSRQTHLELELILVRDGGEPLSEAARQELERLEFPYRVIERDDPPLGLARSRNLGIEAARADAIAFLDDDDLWEREHVKHLSDLLDRDHEADVVYSDARVRKESTDETRMLALPFERAVFERDSFIPPSAFAARRSAFEDHGHFDTEIPYSEDWEWLLRVLKGGGKIARARGVTATIRIHSGGLSHLTPERMADRRKSLEIIAARHKLASIEPKTFWEVAGDLCPDGNASTR